MNTFTKKNLQKTWLIYWIYGLMFLLTSNGYIKAQSPGGVSTGLKLWLKADAGITQSSNNVSQWNDQSTSGLNATAPSQPTFVANSLNFNPTISFNGSSNRLVTASTSLFTTNNSPVSFFTVFNTTNNSGQKFLVNQRFNNNCVTNIQLGYSTGFGGIGNYGLHIGCGNAAVTAAGTIQNNTYNLMSTLILNTGSSPSNINTFRNGLSLSVSNDGSGYTPAGSYETSTQNVPIDIGVRNDAFGGSSFNAYHAGNIGEIIIYTSTPTTTQRRQVESYLALKYGLTIDQTSATDYLASDGTTEMWDKDLAGASTYKNNITGIGRDDASALNQKQSKSINANTPITIGLGSVATTNALNANTFANDRRFLTWADNNTSIASVSTTDIPNASFPRRMARIWQAQESNGDVGNVQVVLDITGTGLTGASANNFVILLDNDVTFANGISNSIVASSLVGNIVTFNNVNFTNGQYFTFANFTGSAISGVRGNMMSFNGSNQFINAGDINQLDGASQVTYETWLYIPSGTWPAFGMIMSKQLQPATAFDRIELVLSGGGQGGDNDLLVVVSDGNPNNANYNTTTNVIQYNTWYHVAMVFDGTLTGDLNRLKLYVNGVQQGSLNFNGAGVVPAQTDNNNGAFCIGSRQDGSIPFRGSLDEVRVWNTARTQAQIRESMHLTLSGIESGLVAYYQFNETSGNAIDAVAGNNGILQNAPTRPASTVSIGKGVSNRQAISTTPTNYNFTGTNCSLNFSSVGTSGEIVVNRLEGSPYGTQLAGTFSVYARYYWVINNYGTAGFSTTPTFVLGPNQISAGDAIAFTNLKLNKRDTNNGLGWTQINGTSATASTGSVSFGAITSFSEFGITSDGTSPLPITLVRFDAKRTNPEQVLLTWQTAQELNNKGFEIEQSTDNQLFKKIGFVDGSGNSNKVMSYEFRVMSSNASYYRLKQMDNDGKFSYSASQYVKGNEINNFVFYPNPAIETLNMELNGKQDSNEIINLRVFNATGEQVWAKTSTLTEMQSLLNTHFKTWKAGLYVIEIQNKDGVKQSKLIKY